jgi:PAS domain S-box-containing protein
MNFLPQGPAIPLTTHADGHLTWVMLFVSLVWDAGGRPLYFLSQIEDITERKRTERAASAES